MEGKDLFTFPTSTCVSAGADLRVSHVRDADMFKLTQNVLKTLTRQPISKDLSAYDDTIKALNGLQSNLSVLIKAANAGSNSQSNNIALTHKYLKRSGVDLEKFERQIPVIHVSGTKGKGTTCNLCESVIRAHGYKTGLFTSPHLISVKERISLNGVPLTYSEFTNHFWSVYSALDNNKENEHDMPSYFKFLTVMAFNVFFKENVDVAIFEVGVGGEYDCTNIFQHTPIVGITSLGLDHTSILGTSLDQIAWQKAGIIKEGCRVFTVDDHKPLALKVIQERAKERNSRLILVPKVDQYNWNLNHFGPAHVLNASLAVQLAFAFLNMKNNITCNGLPELTIDKASENAISQCDFPGRFQIVQRGLHVYYLDGAHTKESVEFCSSWYCSVSQSQTKKIFIFNLTHNRDPATLLKPFTKCKFDRVFFSPNSITTSQNTSPRDLFDLNASLTSPTERLEAYKALWIEMASCDPNCVTVSSSLSETISLVESNNEPSQILVSGSLHLVGSVLTCFTLNGHQ
ncbi:folylpolyglutamate synthase, mitochondrial-like [Cimex lectularius]|uniref:Folylpolyglutamate synthase n=1 Tax=Cimex lectularius TaxID=79782 RepID=A0A8I6TJ76_CIMLE|nr:folylpolyglutamate synthase, mitochondrial-like [Cimex lectularius]